MRKLFLLDAYALIYRAYYAFINNPRINSSGMNTSAIFGFVNTLEDILKNEKPTHIAVSFDPRGRTTFRHDIFAEYKSNRPPTPEDIRIAIPWIKKILKAYNIPIIIIDKYEADDVIGALAKKFASDETTVFMMTPDKDYKQLIDDNIFIYKPGRAKNIAEIIDKKSLQEEYNIENPIQIIDILALWGDTADNIPGVPGVGEKTAAKLISEYKSIDNIYNNIDDFKGKLKENLLKTKEQVYLSKFLVTIDINIDIPYGIDDLIIKPPEINTLLSIFSDLEFNNFIARYSSNNEGIISNNNTENLPKKAKKKEANALQLDLFSSIGIDIENNDNSVKETTNNDYDFSPENVSYHFIDARELVIEE